MGRGLRFAALFFVLVSLWLSSMLYGAKARPVNGLGLPGNAGVTDRGFEESLINGVTAESSGLISAGGKGDAHKYSARTAEAVKYSGPSPGEGHKNAPSNNQ